MNIETISFDAMMYARQIHANQVRKYTGNPYADHLGEVAGIVSTVLSTFQIGWREHMIATCWLHDSMEDQGATEDYLFRRFGHMVTDGVVWLSDLETEGNRAARKAASRMRLSKAPGWVQTIKCADLISNTPSIVKHDPAFAKVYLAEKRLLLDVLVDAHPALHALAASMCDAGLSVHREAAAP